jgi:hypothetical protein
MKFWPSTLHTGRRLLGGGGWRQPGREQEPADWCRGSGGLGKGAGVRAVDGGAGARGGRARRRGLPAGGRCGGDSVWRVAAVAAGRS